MSESVEHTVELAEEAALVPIDRLTNPRERAMALDALAILLRERAQAALTDAGLCAPAGRSEV